jgi:hypothetical protein
MERTLDRYQVVRREGVSKVINETVMNEYMKEGEKAKTVYENERCFLT